MADLHPCRNPACPRLVSALSYFCCAPCNDADYGKYEVHAHSSGCDERDAERRNKASDNDTPTRVAAGADPVVFGRTVQDG